MCGVWFVLPDPSRSLIHDGSVVGVFHQSNKASLESLQGERYEGHFAAITWKLGSHHEHTPDIHKAKESLMSMGMLYAVFFPSVWRNYWMIIL